MENGGGENDKVSRRMWKAVETSIGEVGVGKAERRRKKEEKEKRKKQKKEKTIETRKVAEEWKIWDEEVEVARLEVEAKKLVPEKFHKWIKVFGKKQSERMPMRKV